MAPSDGDILDAGNGPRDDTIGGAPRGGGVPSAVNQTCTLGGDSETRTSKGGAVRLGPADRQALASGESRVPAVYWPFPARYRRRVVYRKSERFRRRVI